jgi:hypothetical protein
MKINIRKSAIKDPLSFFIFSFKKRYSNDQICHILLPSTTAKSYTNKFISARHLIQDTEESDFAKCSVTADRSPLPFVIMLTRRSRSR